ncbi:hypothetical protein SBRCBS47491_006460 [Sporothrix bragantina]|uniref:PB1 domain-containing protein n=1 Tax=Sporothrix bragantina TaxID=671064 RepID=A0ABP0C6D6_9PEZI
MDAPTVPSQPAKTLDIDINEVRLYYRSEDGKIVTSCPSKDLKGLMHCIRSQRKSNEQSFVTKNPAQFQDNQDNQGNHGSQTGQNDNQGSKDSKQDSSQCNDQEKSQDDGQDNNQGDDQDNEEDADDENEDENGSQGGVSVSSDHLSSSNNSGNVNTANVENDDDGGGGGNFVIDIVSNVVRAIAVGNETETDNEDVEHRSISELVADSEAILPQQVYNPGTLGPNVKPRVSRATERALKEQRFYEACVRAWRDVPSMLPAPPTFPLPPSQFTLNAHAAEFVPVAPSGLVLPAPPSDGIVDWATAWIHDRIATWANAEATAESTAESTAGATAGSSNNHPAASSETSQTSEAPENQETSDSPEPCDVPLPSTPETLNSDKM